QDPTDGWIQANLERPRTLTSVSVTLPPRSKARPIEAVTLRFATGDPVTALVNAGANTIIRFPERRTSWVRVSVARAAPSLDASRSVGIADIGIPGLRPAEIIRVPDDLARAVESLGVGSTFAAMPVT